MNAVGRRKTPHTERRGENKRNRRHRGAAPGDAGDKAQVACFNAVVDAVEAAIQPIASLARHRRSQPQRALGRLQGCRIDRADQRRRRDDQRKLRVHAPARAGEEGGRHEYRHQHQRDADDRPEQLVHCLDGSRAARQPRLDVARRTLDDHDRVVDDNADCQHHREQAREIDRETERRHRGEGADDRHRHRRRRHQDGPPVLHEQDNYEQHENSGLDQRLVDLVDRGPDRLRRIERDRVGQPRRKRARQLGHLGVDTVRGGQGIGLGRLEDFDPGRSLAVQLEPLPIGLGAQLDARDVLQPGNAAVVGLDDNLAEFLGLLQAAADIDGILETLPGRRRRHADLTGGDLLVLLLNSLDHLLRRQAQRDQPVRIEPDAHRIFAGAEHAGMTDAGDPRQLVDEVDRCVIAQKKPVIPAVGRAQRNHLQESGRLLPHRHALRLHALRQGRQGAGDAVLHPDLRQVQVGAGLERDGQRVVAVAGARRLHVEHAFDAVDRALDRQRDGIDEGLRAAAGIARGHDDRRRRDVRVLRDWQPRQSHGPDQDEQDRQDIGEYRAVDEKLRNHRAASARFDAAALATISGLTFWPGTARNRPATITLSSAPSPFSMTRMSPTAGPTVTLRLSTTSSLSTTSTYGPPWSLPSAVCGTSSASCSGSCDGGTRTCTNRPGSSP